MILWSYHCSVALVWIMYFLARKFFTFKKDKVMYIWFLLILVSKKLTKKPFTFALFGCTQSLKSSHFLNYKKAKPQRKYKIKLASKNFSRSPVSQIWMTYFPANCSKILSVFWNFPKKTLILPQIGSRILCSSMNLTTYSKFLILSWIDWHWCNFQCV